jgi:bacterial/archaeal transporter family protein
LYNIFIKKGSATINPVLGGVVLQFVAAILGLILLVALILKEGCDQVKQVVYFDKWGILWSVAAGLSVGTAEMLSFYISGIGVPATRSIPILIGGSVIFGSVLGATLLHETMTYRGWLGVCLLVVGIGLVAIDPGKSIGG